MYDAKPDVPAAVKTLGFANPALRHACTLQLPCDRAWLWQAAAGIHGARPEPNLPGWGPVVRREEQVLLPPTGANWTILREEETKLLI